MKEIKIITYFPQFTSSHTTRSPPVEQITQNVYKLINKCKVIWLGAVYASQHTNGKLLHKRLYKIK